MPMKNDAPMRFVVSLQSWKAATQCTAVVRKAADRFRSIIAGVVSVTCVSAFSMDDTLLRDAVRRWIYNSRDDESPTTRSLGSCTNLSSISHFSSTGSHTVSASL